MQLYIRIYVSMYLAREYSALFFCIHSSILINDDNDNDNRQTYFKKYIFKKDADRNDSSDSDNNDDNNNGKPDIKSKLDKVPKNGTTLRNLFIGYMTSVSYSVKTAMGEFFIQVCDNSPDEMIRLVGFGAGIGHLVNKGVPGFSQMANQGVNLEQMAALKRKREKAAKEKAAKEKAAKEEKEKESGNSNANANNSSNNKPKKKVFGPPTREEAESQSTGKGKGTPTVTKDNSNNDDKANRKERFAEQTAKSS